ncbi:MAG TPA: endo alpha-1,4 polygalactosaminidase [Candidatus Binatia bacterium]|nr:endo alpha-1,4 polygalactosaminidase [Candidatus Binatia bacterium]
MSNRRAVVAFATLIALGTTAPRAGAGGTPAQVCASGKIKAAGKAAACLLNADARGARGQTVDAATLQACRDKLEAPLHGDFARAEARGGCLTTGDAGTIEGKIDAFVDDVDGTLAVGTPNVCQSAKLRAAARETSCLLGLRAKAATGTTLDSSRVQRCKDRLGGPAGTFTREDAGGGCATNGDAGTIEDKVDAFVDDVVAEEPAVATCASAGCPTSVACDTSTGACWQPALVTRPQYQLQAAVTSSGDCAFPVTGGIDTALSAVPYSGGPAVSPDVFDIDFLTDPTCVAGGSNDVDDTDAVNAIHARGARVICYVDAGTDEPFRPDHQAYLDFDAACGGCLLGKPVSGFREEHWVNIDDDQGQRDFLLGIVTTRIDRCVADGFDAVEFDNVDGYANDTGLPFSEATQLLFDTALANLAHQKGLTVGLKNDLGQIGELLPYFDFAINEQCQQYHECAALDPFVAAGKPVFQVEYQVGAGTVCPPANAANRNAILKSVDLFDVPWTPCR